MVLNTTIKSLCTCTGSVTKMFAMKGYLTAWEQLWSTLNNYLWNLQTALNLQQGNTSGNLDIHVFNILLSNFVWA